MYKAKVAMFISTVCHTVRSSYYLPRVIVLCSAADVRYLLPVLCSASLSDVHVFFSPVLCTFNRYHACVLNTGGTGIVLCFIIGQLYCTSAVLLSVPMQEKNAMSCKYAKW
jgi:hypothetical protein